MAESDVPEAQWTVILNQKCELCDINPIAFKCLNCDEMVCDHCKTTHLRSKLGKGHKVVCLKTAEICESNENAKKCPSHTSEDLLMFCNTCNCPICRECVTSGVHIHHPIVKIEEVIEIKEKQLSNFISKANEKSKKYKDVITTITRNKLEFSMYIAKKIDMVKSRNRELKIKLDKIESDYIKELVNTDNENKKAMAELEQKLQGEMSDLNNMIQQCERKQRYRNVEMIHFVTDVTRRLDKYRSCEPLNVACPSDLITRHVDDQEVKNLFGYLDTKETQEVNLPLTKNRNIPSSSTAIDVNPPLPPQRNISSAIPAIDANPLLPPNSNIPSASPAIDANPLLPPNSNIPSASPAIDVNPPLPPNSNIQSASPAIDVNPSLPPNSNIPSASPAIDVNPSLPPNSNIPSASPAIDVNPSLPPNSNIPSASPAIDVNPPLPPNSNIQSASPAIDVNPSLPPNSNIPSVSPAIDVNPLLPPNSNIQSTSPVVDVKIISSFYSEKSRVLTTSNKKACLWSRSYKNISLVTSDGKVIQDIKTDFEVHDVAVCTPGDLLVTVFIGNKVKKLKRNNKFKDIYTADGYDTLGITITDTGNILVGLYKIIDSKIVEITTSGRHIRTIQNDTVDNKRLFKYPGSICTNMNGDIIVVDDDKVVAVNKSGTKRFIYDGSERKLSKSFSPQSAVTDKHGQIIISDSTNSVLHVLDRNGVFIQYLTKREHGCDNPMGISVDGSGILWVCDPGNEKVSKIKYM